MKLSPLESERLWREHLPLREWMGWHKPRADDLIPTPPINWVKSFPPMQYYTEENIPYEKE